MAPTTASLWLRPSALGRDAQPCDRVTDEPRGCASQRARAAVAIAQRSLALRLVGSRPDEGHVAQVGVTAQRRRRPLCDLGPLSSRSAWVGGELGHRGLAEVAAAD